ncbi:hypothetical protein pfor_12c1000 [Rhodobacteraceae bacterium SB2]|nr:hypothetical protein pfor_12c1000 [Rhodobacteraceae bacterium SB2]
MGTLTAILSFTRQNRIADFEWDENTGKLPPQLRIGIPALAIALAALAITPCWAWPWIGAMALYALFLSHYQNWRGPLTKPEIDMSGDKPLTVRLHEHFTNNMLATWVVGATHWEDGGKPPANLPGAKPTFFFAPPHMGKRDKDWGPGKFWQKASTASIKVTQDTAALLNIVSQTGADEANASWLGLLDNKVPGSTGLIVSI